MRVRSVALLLALIGLVALAGGTSRAALSSDAAARERACAVIVWSHIAEHRDAIGAGVIVAFAGHRMRIVTARHVVAFGAVTVWRDGRLYAAEVARTFSHRDLAVVDAIVTTSDERGCASVAVADSVRPGQPIAVWGEDDKGPKLELGTIVTRHLPALGDPAGRELVDVTCDACRQGDSGAGIFDEEGRLIAILTARYRTASDETVALVGEPVEPSLYAFG